MTASVSASCPRAGALRRRAGALLIASVAGLGGCQRLASRLSQNEPGAPAAPAPAPPSENEPAPPPPASPGLQPGAAVTPKTETPNEARVLSSAFSAVAKALRPS